MFKWMNEFFSNSLQVILLWKRIFHLFQETYSIITKEEKLHNR